MYTYEFCFYTKSDLNEEEFLYSLQNYMSSLILNGQILEEYQNLVKYKDHFKCRFVIPERKALNSFSNNNYDEKFRKKLTEFLVEEIKCIEIGINADVDRACECEKSEYYILSGDNDYAVSPILCGNCNKSIPLYKLPKTYENSDYYDILNWQKTYKAYDSLFMNSYSERHAYKMINSIDSKMVKEGRRICAFIQEVTKIPVYYFLFKYYKKNSNTCPGCGEYWVFHQKDGIYSHVCHTCKLISKDIV